MSVVCIHPLLVARRSQTPASQFHVAPPQGSPTLRSDDPRYDVLSFLRRVQEERDEALDEGNEIGNETLGRLRSFVEAFPSDVPLPDPQVIYGGKILLEWCKGPNLSLALAIGPSSKIHFASLIQGAAFNGNANFAGDQLPAEFMALVRQWTAC